MDSHSAAAPFGGAKFHETGAVPDSVSVTKRLQNELMQLMISSPPGISAFPVSDSNLHQWTGVIDGPEGTYYEGLSFKISMSFPTNYPYTAPTIKFVSPMWHPNIDMSGVICLDILKENWSAIYNVQTILLSLQSLLGEPNNASPLNAQAAELWGKNPAEYKRLLMKRYREIDEVNDM
ncbi:ubiquitin-conjugating enzyme/RWD-like protein [Dipodascopsis tothii]|uniref:ubiquitin-conjugating enzyme/RWD-like protein n=1 Tax=Dipodascopsis tothii TaxID=44089 RepID=UPI0034CE22DE